MMHLDGAPTSILRFHKKRTPTPWAKTIPPKCHRKQQGGFAIGDAVEVTADGSTYF